MGKVNDILTASESADASARTLRLAQDRAALLKALRDAERFLRGFGAINEREDTPLRRVVRSALAAIAQAERP